MWTCETIERERGKKERDGVKKDTERKGGRQTEGSEKKDGKKIIM